MAPAPNAGIRPSWLRGAVRRRELERPHGQRHHAEPRVEAHSDLPHLGRLRGLLRSRAPATYRHLRVRATGAADRDQSLRSSRTVFSEVSDFSSVLRFIERIHGLPWLTARDRDANDLMGAFDFEQDPLERLVLRSGIAPLPPNG